MLSFRPMDPIMGISSKNPPLEAIRGHLVDAIERGEESCGGSTDRETLRFLRIPKEFNCRG